MTLTKRFLIAEGFVAGTGGVLVVGGSFAAIDIQGGYASEWMLNGMNIGVLLTGLGAVAAITGGALARRHPPRPVR